MRARPRRPKGGAIKAARRPQGGAKRSKPRDARRAERSDQSRAKRRLCVRVDIVVNLSPTRSENVRRSGSGRHRVESYIDSTT